MESDVFQRIKYKMKSKMNTKKILVSLLAIVSVLVITSMVSASQPIVNFKNVQINGVSYEISDGEYSGNNPISVVAGEIIPVRAIFTGLNLSNSVSDVRMDLKIKAKTDASVRSQPFVVEPNTEDTKFLNIRVPFDLKDVVSDDDFRLEVEIWSKGYSSRVEIPLRIRRPIYNAEIAFVNVKRTVEAGESFPVEVVVKNMGYNRLDDVLVTVEIPALGISRSAFLGRIAELEKCEGDCNYEDTVTGRIFLDVPYGVEDGFYTLEVRVDNEDTSSSVVRELVIKNEFTNVVIPVSTRKSVGVKQTAEFDMLIVNPTNKLVVYQIVPQSTAIVSSSASESVVAIPAGSSKTVRVLASANEEGLHNFDVSVLSAGETVGQTRFSLDTTEGSAVTANPVIVLTIILAIIFAVLLVVLIVLLSKKPEKTEEFGESYY
jgi:hypothetical protein